MRCLVVGADRNGFLPRLKEKFGVEEVVHWNGRIRKMPRKLPRQVGIVVIYTGFVSHALMYAVKRLARENGVRVVFLKRGLAELDSKYSSCC
ncbi:MAG: DUF2325 domain-containing protein [Bacillota bacterium]|nr:DUF2325 domain-containing protein [Bacillota bacterium]